VDQAEDISVLITMIVTIMMAVHKVTTTNGLVVQELNIGLGAAADKACLTLL
jgi:hypothetical protein